MRVLRAWCKTINLTKSVCLNPHMLKVPVFNLWVGYEYLLFFGIYINWELILERMNPNFIGPQHAPQFRHLVAFVVMPPSKTIPFECGDQNPI